MFLVVIRYFDLKNVLNAKMTIKMIIQLRQKNLRFCKIIGANTLEAKNSKIGIASYLRTNQHKMIRFAAFCRELHTSKATRSKNLQIVTNVAQLINVYIC